MNFYGFKRLTADKEENQVSASELTQIYHTFKHNLSYNSLDCCIKVEKKIYKDFKMLSKFHLGRTKAEIIVTEVLVLGIENKLIDFYENPHEIADEMGSYIKKII